MEKKFIVRGFTGSDPYAPPNPEIIGGIARYHSGNRSWISGEYDTLEKAEKFKAALKKRYGDLLKFMIDIKS